jgi:uncharacterized protein (UPF0332 family)
MDFHDKNYVKTGKIPRYLARIYIDLFERRQEGDYIDFVSVHPETGKLGRDGGVRKILPRQTS